MSVRAKFNSAALIGFGILCLASCSKLHSVSVGHQRPYGWDKFGLPELRFTNATVSEVVEAVNNAARLASDGTVTQAVILNATPAEIVPVMSDPEIKAAMERLIAGFRDDETQMAKRGAEGFETCRYTGTFMANHSLGCSLSEMSDSTGLSYEERPDAIHLGRMPARLECKAYKITSGLKQMAEDLKSQNQVRVDTNPVTSAFIDVAKVYLWSINVPTGTNETTGTFRYASVFKYLPEKSVLLVIETPEAHETALQNLKENGFWESM